MKLQVFGKELELDGSLVEASREETREQVEEFLSGDREEFDLEFSVPESFTGDVMRETLKIPRGETRTYGELAEELGTAPVAVGQALGRNLLPVIVPCHRVVAKDSIGGYMGKEGNETKEKLLELEGIDPDEV